MYIPAALIYLRFADISFLEHSPNNLLFMQSVRNAIFKRKTVVKNCLNARVTFFCKTEHIHFLHVSMLGGINCSLGNGDETNFSKTKKLNAQEIVLIFISRGSILMQEISFVSAWCEWQSLSQSEEHLHIWEVLCTKKMPSIRYWPLKTTMYTVKFLKNLTAQHTVDGGTTRKGTWF